MSTARDLIIGAFRLGIIPDSDVPSGDEMTIGLTELNDIINILNLDGLWPYTNKREDVLFTAGDIEFTIGLGADLNIERPLQVEQVLINVGNIWYPLNQQGTKTFDSRTQWDGVNAIPHRYTYRADFPHGILRFDVGFGSNYNGRIIYNFQIQEYALDDQINLPVGYEATLKYLLGANLSGRYNLPNEFVGATARSRLKALKHNNSQVSVLKTGRRTGQYNVFADRNM